MRIRKQKTASIYLMVVVVLSLLLSTGLVLVNAATAPPKPRSPRKEITDRTPTYKWSPVAGATKYRFRVYQGTNLVLEKTVGSGVCSATKCISTPTKTLQYKQYKWRVAAYEGGAWTAYSSNKKFTVVQQSAGFYDKFTNNFDDWSEIKGVWSISSGNLYTQGVVGEWASVAHDGEYRNLEYSARMKRNSSANCAFGLILRGDPTIHPFGDGSWYEGYQFLISTAGQFGVTKGVAGSWTWVKGWTASGAIKTSDYNVLKIKANGKNLKFIINGTKVWSGIDKDLTNGQVGIMMFREASSTGNELFVDWAKVNPMN